LRLNRLDFLSADVDMRGENLHNDRMGAMTDNPAGAPDAASADSAPEAAASAPGASEALVHEVAEMKDRLLRTLAEMENLRRRTEREVADARAYGVSAFARDLLVVADNMRRALEAAAPEAADPAVKPLLEGVELTEREFLKTLEKHGVRKFVPQGEKFDPNRHQAMFEVPDPSAPSGTVVQVMQAGFMIGDRVLRPALVGVAKGGPKGDAANTNDTRAEAQGSE
jgi:molecular chaperone GrpE